jgi:hypothetical protein
MAVLMRALAVALALAALGCGGSSGLAQKLAVPPAFEPAGQSKCGVRKSPNRPLIVEWPSADRGALEAQSRKGTVVVRYAGCEMELLRQCRAPGRYVYTPVTPKHDRIRIRNADELYATVPVYAAKLEGKLAAAGELGVDMAIVGSFEADRDEVKTGELEGDCARATHFVTAITAGAFDFTAGAEAEVAAGAETLVGGGGTRSKAARETLARDGTREACARATSDDRAPPEGCSALLRVEVAPLAAAAGIWSAADPAAPAPGWGPSPFANAAEPPAVAMPSRGESVGVAALWTGGVVTVIGGVTAAGAIALDAHLDEACGDGQCPPDERGTVRTYDALATIGGVGLVGGAALLVTGLVLVLTAPSGSKEDSPAGQASIRPLFAPGVVGLAGEWP